MERLILYFIIFIIPVILKSISQKNNKQTGSKRPNNPNAVNNQSHDSRRYQTQHGVREINKKTETAKQGNLYKVRAEGGKSIANPQKASAKANKINANIHDDEDTEYYSREAVPMEGSDDRANSEIRTSDNYSINRVEEVRFDITEDLQKSIIAVEILGPPRAIRKNIR